MKIESKTEQLYKAISNPSGAVALTNDLFIVGDDEDNRLRIYDRNKPEKPLQTVSLSEIFKGIIEEGEDLEIDLESAAETAGTVFWIGSHSTSKNAEFRPARHRLFAVNIKTNAKNNVAVTAVGDIYTSLINDLRDDSRFDRYHFGKAAKLQAKAIGGLSIEGLASTADNELVIGFRNPLHGGDVKKDRLKKGKAIIVILKNPFAVIHGVKAEFADPIELDLDGFGIPEITRRTKNKYLIVAGPYHANIPDENHKLEESKLYQWSMKSGKLDEVKGLDLAGLNIEAAIFYPDDEDTVQLLSDDGKMMGATGFRSLTVQL